MTIIVVGIKQSMAIIVVGIKQSMAIIVVGIKQSVCDKWVQKSVAFLVMTSDTRQYQLLKIKKKNFYIF